MKGYLVLAVSIVVFNITLAFAVDNTWRKGAVQLERQKDIHFTTNAGMRTIESALADATTFKTEATAEGQEIQTLVNDDLPLLDSCSKRVDGEYVMPLFAPDGGAVRIDTFVVGTSCADYISAARSYRDSSAWHAGYVRDLWQKVKDITTDINKKCQGRGPAVMERPRFPKEAAAPPVKKFQGIGLLDSERARYQMKLTSSRTNVASEMPKFDTFVAIIKNLQDKYRQQCH